MRSFIPRRKQKWLILLPNPASELKTVLASKFAQSSVSTKATTNSTFTQTSALTVALASQLAQSAQFSQKKTCPANGKALPPRTAPTSDFKRFKMRSAFLAERFILAARDSSPDLHKFFLESSQLKLLTRAVGLRT